MRKIALPLTVATLVMSVFGAFLRWLQVLGLFDPETGLAAPMAGISIVFTVYSLLAAAAMLGISLWLRRRMEQPTEAEEALRYTGVLPRAVAVLCAAMLAAAALQAMFTAGNAQSPLMQRLFGAAGLVAAAAMVALPGKGDGSASATARSASLWLPLFFGYWLVLVYRANAQDPVLWHYVVFALAVAMSAMGFYALSSWYFHKGRPLSGLLYIQLGIYFDICALSDERGLGDKLLLIAAAAMLVVMEYLLLRNMKPKEGEAA